MEAHFTKYLTVFLKTVKVKQSKVTLKSITAKRNLRRDDEYA